jgi:hypothetical protein
VQILEDEYEGTRLGKRFEVPPPGGERFSATVCDVDMASFMSRLTLVNSAVACVALVT